MRSPSDSMDSSGEYSVRRTAFLVACAAALQTAESMLPHPLPGVRLGLANMIVLLAMDRIGFRVAAEIAVLRPILSSLMLGTFLSPAFILSFSASIVSTVVMGLLYRWATACRRPPISLIGISVAGAAAHNVTQLALAYLLLLRFEAIFLLLPWLGIVAVVTGWITGWAASAVCRRLAAEPAVAPDEKPVVLVGPATSGVHRRAGTLKIGATILLAVAVLVIQTPAALLLILAGLLAVGLVVRMPAGALLRRLIRMLPLLCGAFLVPVLLVRSGSALSVWPVTVHMDGLAGGGLVVLRLVLLLTSSSLLSHTASPLEIVAGLETLFRPLAFFGLSPKRTANILGTAWQLMPEVWESSRRLASQLKERAARDGLLSALVQALGSLFGRADSGAAGRPPKAS